MCVSTELYSVLDVPENSMNHIHLLHHLFCDFLLDKQRCPDQHFWINKKETHDALVKSCLQLMSSNLKRDTCNLHTPGICASEIDNCWVEQCLPADLQYSCQYWVQHIQRSEIELQILSTLHNHLLREIKRSHLSKRSHFGLPYRERLFSDSLPDIDWVSMHPQNHFSRASMALILHQGVDREKNWLIYEDLWGLQGKRVLCLSFPSLARHK